MWYIGFNIFYKRILLWAHFKTIMIFITPKVIYQLSFKINQKNPHLQIYHLANGDFFVYLKIIIGQNAFGNEHL